jgi:hypothetical protein
VLAGDVGTHAVTLASATPAGMAATQWTAIDLGDGSFELELTDKGGRVAYLGADTATGKVLLRDQVAAGDYGTKWRIVVGDDGAFALRTVGGNDQGVRWLSGAAASGAVALAATAGAWDIQVR